MSIGAPSFSDRVADLRCSGKTLLDLAETDPGRCGLGVDCADVEAARAAARNARADAAESLARDAVASYLAGRSLAVPPGRVVLAASRAAALQWALAAVCEAGGEIVVPAPCDASMVAAAEAVSATVRRIPLGYDSEWRLDVRALRDSLTGRTRAVLLGNPSEPSGMALGEGDVALLQRLCAGHGIALVGNEAFIDTVAPPAASVLDAPTLLSIHGSDLAAVCGLSSVEIAWCAVGGPDHLVEAALAKQAGAVVPAPLSSDLAVLPILLARRGEFQERLRRRIAENRAQLAAAALREAPWSLRWGRGGRWCVLDVGSAVSTEELRLALLDEGVVVAPNTSFGLPVKGYVVLSLLPYPDLFREALERMEKVLRAPLS
jgi:aspartate/methionine/tyrosine aminotransferase